MAGSTLLLTPRLRLRPPRLEDAEMIFAGFASDPDTTRWLAWPRHHGIADTHRFLEFSQEQWRRWPAGPLLIEAREAGQILGSTGLAFETPERASTGYLLKPAARGQGYAREALTAVVGLAGSLEVERLYALCHPQNTPSIRLLLRCGFTDEGLLAQHTVFPNLGDARPQDVHRFTIAPDRHRPPAA